jgi:UDP-N-acetylglucosamine--N-acetylmuramyl-(pentapeptide) pyrophosphoryl-undecaprenol N-acetylglucosamine transferase
MSGKKTKKIMFSGGGTGGSVTPLLAVASELIKEDSFWDFVFVGTKTGPERELVANFSKTKEMKFLTLNSGKLRRYFSWSNFFDIFRIFWAFFQALVIIRRFKPDLVVSAGSFVSVPLVFAAALKKVPILIHQQDVRPGLANKLMAPFARVISVTFEKSLIDYGPKAILIGNPVKDLSAYKLKIKETREKYGLLPNLPVVLVIGGGTGARAINDLIYQTLPELTAFCQVIHLTGKGKSIGTKKNNNYQSFEFLANEEVLALLAAADLVVSRSGLGVLTELAALSKAAILIPLPHSHQENNAELVARAEAALILPAAAVTPSGLIAALKKILSDQNLAEKLRQNIGKIIKSRAAENMAGIIWEMLKTKK